MGASGSYGGVTGKVVVQAYILRQGREEMEKLIISVGVTGSRVLPVQTPYMKITPKEIADDAIRAAEAGAAATT